MLTARSYRDGGVRRLESFCGWKLRLPVGPAAACSLGRLFGFSFAVALTLAAPGLLKGQMSSACWLESGGGVAIPAGELGEVTAPGYRVGLGGGCPVTGRLALAGRVGLDVLGPLGSGSTVDQLSLLAELRLSLIGGGRIGTRTSLAARAAAGPTIMDSREDILVGPQATRILLLHGTHFTTEAGARANFPLSGRLSVFVDAAWRLVFVDEADRDTRFGFEEGFGKLSSFPVSLGVELRL